MKYLSKFIIALAIFFSFTELCFAEEAYQCIWRNPERTMMRIFPDAKDYKTITKKISAEDLIVIEEKAGALLPGQKDAFQYYELFGEDNASLGYIFASTQKGEYGAIEFVFGVDTKGEIIGIYVQRSRERDKEFRKKEFLDLFIGKTGDDIDNIEYTETVGTKAILYGFLKELTVFEVVNTE